MNEIIIGLVILTAFAAYTVYRRFKAGTYIANDTMFSQAGIIVYFQKQKISYKGRDYGINAVTNVQTEPPPRDQTMAYDCVISLSDFKTPEIRLRFINRGQANKFMQRLCTAIEKAGGPSYS